MQAKCPSCQAPLTYDSKFFGKRFKCAKCLQVVEINKQGSPQLVAPSAAIAQAFKPAPADSHPINYKCKHCKAVLETDASLGMQEEACPLCKKMNHVPPSREQHREQKEREKAVQRQFKEQHQQEEAARCAEAQCLQKQQGTEEQVLAVASPSPVPQAPRPQPPPPNQRQSIPESVPGMVRCPKCGSTNIQVVSQAETKGFGCGKGCCGAIFLGPFGWLCGLCGMGKGKSKIARVCAACGKQF